MNELDEAMDAIPNLTERQIELLIEYQLQELANYGGKKSRAKKDQSEEDLMATLELMIKTETPPKPTGFKRRA